MGRRTWATGLVLCAGLADPQATAAQQPSRPIVYVLTMDRAEVPADTLERAQNQATHVFQLSGITLVWVDGDTCQARCLTVLIVMQPVSEKSRDPRVLGVAPGTKEVRGVNLWIFYPRIESYSVNLGMRGSELLGHVIAHEMGHLLLPYDAHSVMGLMRPAWDRAQVSDAARGLLTFTADQAALIRERLQASASPSARAR